MRSKLPLLAVVGAAALTLSACAAGGGTNNGGNDASGGTLKNDGTFSMSISSDPGTLDPTKTTLSIARAIDRFLYGRLVEADENGEIQPALAESWDVDTTMATFVLREGLTCEDGTELTATAVADNFNYIGDPANAAPILGLQVQPGTTAVADDATRTVTVTSGAPDSFLLDNLGSVHLVCGNVIGDEDALSKGKGATGMFTMTEIAANSQYTMTRREGYNAGPGDWDAKQDGIPAKIVVKVIPNESTSVNMLISGELNSVSVVGPDRQRLIDGGYFTSKLLAPIGQVTFRQADGAITADFAVREALIQALNRDEMRAVIGSGEATVPKSLVTVAPNPCAADNYAAATIPAFDAETAAAGLDAAGWKLGSDGIRAKGGEKLTLRLLYGTQLGDAYTATAELVQQALTGIGVDVVMKGVDSPGLSEAYFATSDWDVSLAPITVGFPSQLVPFYSGPAAPNGMNFASLNNEDYVAGVTAGASKAGKEGCDDWNAAEQALLNTLSVVPYADIQRGSFANKATYREDDGIVPTSIRLYE